VRVRASVRACVRACVCVRKHAFLRPLLERPLLRVRACMCARDAPGARELTRLHQRACAAEQRLLQRRRAALGATRRHVSRNGAASSNATAGCNAARRALALALSSSSALLHCEIVSDLVKHGAALQTQRNMYSAAVSDGLPQRLPRKQRRRQEPGSMPAVFAR
jgi:hypothetical protein